MIFEPIEPGDQSFGLAQRVGQPGFGQSEHADRLLPVLGAPGDRGLHRIGGNRRAPHRLQLAGRTRQHDHGRGPGDHDTRCGADGVEDHRAGGDEGLLAVGRQHRLGVDSGEPGRHPVDDRPDGGFQPGVEDQFPAAEARHDLDRHIVGRRTESATGDDQIDPLIGQELQLRLDIGGAVTAQGDVPELHTEFQQTVGEPGTVAILDASGEDFGSRHHDPGSRAHEI